MTHFNCSYNVNWYCNDYHHEKGPMDKLGGTVKNKTLRHRPGKSSKVKTVNDEGFAK